MPQSLEQISDEIRRAFYDQFEPIEKLESVAVDGGSFWIAETFADYVIAGKGGKYWMVPFSQGDEGFIFADKLDWQEVEEKKEWIAKIKAFKALAVKVLDEDDDIARVGGYGVYFGGNDLVLEHFENDTDFMLDLVPKKVVTYDHMLPDAATKIAVKDFLGETITEKVDDVGIWVEAQLDKSKKYVKYVLQMIEKGLIGWSSASAPQLVLMAGKKIERWPIVEYSLTPTPAEPRALGVERLKALADMNPSLKMALQKDPGKGSKASMKADHAKLQLQVRAKLLVNKLERLT